jgi:hypothetical protein
MRKGLWLIGLPISAVGVAAVIAVGIYTSHKKAARSLGEDLAAAQAAGLELAQAQGANKFALTETAAPAPDTGKTIRKGAGPKAIRSATPTVNAAPENTTAVEDVPQAPIVQTAAAPTIVEPAAPAVPRPVQATMPEMGDADGSILRGGVGRDDGGAGSRAGTDGTNRGSGRNTDIGTGGVWGVVIRGGGVGHDDCDPRRHGTRPTATFPVYGANPHGMGSGRTATNTSVRQTFPQAGSAPTPRVAPAGSGVAARPRGGR